MHKNVHCATDWRQGRGRRRPTVDIYSKIEGIDQQLKFWVEQVMCDAFNKAPAVNVIPVYHAD